MPIIRMKPYTGRLHWYELETRARYLQLSLWRTLIEGERKLVGGGGGQKSLGCEVEISVQSHLAWKMWVDSRACAHGQIGGRHLSKTVLGYHRLCSPFFPFTQRTRDLGAAVAGEMSSSILSGYTPIK